jgi:Mg-chelatase subunit ChlD
MWYPFLKSLRALPFLKSRLGKTLLQKKLKGVAMMPVVGVTLAAVGLGLVAVDVPLYMTYLNQLQTTTDAAVLAGAAALPDGETQAQQAAIAMAAQNPVGGQTLSGQNLSFEFIPGNDMTMIVNAHVNVPTVMARMVCTIKNMGQSGHYDDPQSPESGNGQSGNGIDASNSSCDFFQVKTSSKAIPAARDTVLVIDTSNSMDDLGQGQPFKDVKDAAKRFVDVIEDLNASNQGQDVDRLAVVKFDATGVKTLGLTDNYASARTAITNLKLYSGSGWNTNYYAGLALAVSELQANGRKNASKSIIFMTDGYANLPGGSTNINTCVSNYNNRKYTTAKTCATNYTNFMINSTTAEIAKAATLEATIHTIQIGGDDSASLNTLQTLLQKPNWDPKLLYAMANTTDGQQYAARNDDGAGIMEIYQTVAEDVRLRLAG